MTFILTVFGRSGRCTYRIGLLAAFLMLVHAGSAPASELRLDPAKVKGPDACGECHKSSVAAWKKSHHATTFKDLPRSKKAKGIAKKMGLRRIKAESDCLSCHFTSAVTKKGKVKPIAGITCESCHGAGADWIKTHADFGGKGVTRDTEAPAHRKQRYDQAVSAGMIRPSNLYDVANNCFECHTVPNEKLVNVGEHPAGSAFDLVSWSQGEVRHNVWYSKDNDEASANRKRMMYVVGKMLDLEHALRGVAKATEKAAYAVAMAKRAKAAMDSIAKIAQAVKSPEIDAIVAATADVELKLNNAAQLTGAADKVSASAKAFAAENDGSALSAVDPMVPGPDTYKGAAVN